MGIFGFAVVVFPNAHILLQSNSIYCLSQPFFWFSGGCFPKCTYFIAASFNLLSIATIFLVLWVVVFPNAHNSLQLHSIYCLLQQYFWCFGGFPTCTYLLQLNSIYCLLQVSAA